MFWLLVFTTVCNKACPAHLPTSNSFLHRIEVHRYMSVAKMILEMTFIEMCIICDPKRSNLLQCVLVQQSSSKSWGRETRAKRDGECTLQSLMFMRGNYPLLFCLFTTSD